MPFPSAPDSPRWLLPLLGLLAPVVSPAAPPSLESELLRQAPRLVRHIENRRWKNVGVLKFMAATGGARSVSDRLGPIQIQLATRLEIALVLSLPPGKAPLFGVIHDASTVAASLPNACHTTPAGRKSLFAGKYPLAWGKQQVAAAAFLTGQVSLSDDLKEMTVDVESVDPVRAKPESLARFTVAASVTSIMGAGRSFLLRGDSLDVVHAQRSAAAVQSGKALHPLKDPAAPVALEVRYDDHQTPLRVEKGWAWVASPKKGQKVTLVVTRKGAGKQRLGVVVKVNGFNTLFRQTLPDNECTRWVLRPEDKELVIRGFQLDAKKLAPFDVQTPPADREKIYYGADVGVISLAVFTQRAGVEKGLALDDEAEARRAIVQGVFPVTPPKNWMALRAQLREGVVRGQGLRGMIGSSKPTDQPLREIEFRAGEAPLLAASLRYARP